MAEAETLPRIRALIGYQRDLLAAILAGTIEPAEADAEYRRNHAELRELLSRRNRPCFCPWASVHAWPHAYARDTVDHDEVLDHLLTPFGDLLNPSEPPPWTLVYYRRGGSLNDLPFAAFEAGLTDAEFAVLDESLKRELAIRGLDASGHIWPCGGGSHPQPKVRMFSIEEGAPSRRVVLRVFYVSAPHRRLALLHGYNKGLDDSKAGEAAAASVACDLRKDFEAQLADDATAGPAVSATR